jgi:hypothetical protein
MSLTDCLSAENELRSVAMDWEYKIMNERNLLVVRASGKFTVAAFEKMIMGVLSDNQWSPGMDCLMDHSALDLSETHSDEIQAAAEIHKRYDTWIGHGRVAMVLGSEKDFDKGRQYETLVETAVCATVKSFRTPDEARQWLAGCT